LLLAESLLIPINVLSEQKKAMGFTHGFEENYMSVITKRASSKQWVAPTALSPVSYQLFF
jgi:hypothetical protein